MGYYTHFDLELKTASDNNLFAMSAEDAEPIIAELRSEYDEAEYTLSEDGTSEESSKWYGHESDMRAFSLKHPDIVFVLSGEGEESGDLWQEYYRNGKRQRVTAEIVYAPFNPSELS